MILVSLKNLNVPLKLYVSLIQSHFHCSCLIDVKTGLGQTDGHKAQSIEHPTGVGRVAGLSPAVDFFTSSWHS